MTWLAGEPNPFNLVAPPAWFLADLAAYDPALVIFPSQQEGVYRVGRRVPGHLPPVLHFLRSQPDTQLYVKHRLVPVTSILPPPLVQWGPVIINDLAESDIQRVGGWKAAVRLIEDREDAADQKLDATIADEASLRAGAAWRAIKWRTGQTIDLGSRSGGPRSRREAPRMPTYRPLQFEGGSATFVGRVGRPFTPARNRGAFHDTDTIVSVPR